MMTAGWIFLVLQTILRGPRKWKMGLLPSLLNVGAYTLHMCSGRNLCVWAMLFKTKQSIWCYWNYVPNSYSFFILQFAIIFCQFTIYVSFAQSVQRRARFPGLQNFSLSSVQTNSAAHPAPPIQWVLGGLFCQGGIKQQGCAVDHSPPCSAKVKKSGAIPPLSHVFMALCLTD
jgi:hypothetical protein